MLTKLSHQVRPLARRDLADVLAIERACYCDPWSESDFDRILRSPRSFALAAEDRGELCGYLIGEREGGRVQLWNLCVDHRARRRGVATRLLRRVARQLRQGQRLMTIVSERNLPAQLFYRAQEFRAVSILRFFWSPTDDAYLFEYRPGESAAPFLPANRVAAYL
ncbi:MAG TPA: GNAT family N-acetyltransferase [Pirellulales bacterium]|nr:GNAT family N-acetyltransferase [Pirellulales bacterium]